jgi:hypothetical protein
MAALGFSDASLSPCFDLWSVDRSTAYLHRARSNPARCVMSQLDPLSRLALTPACRKGRNSSDDIIVLRPTLVLLSLIPVSSSVDT